MRSQIEDDVPDPGSTDREISRSTSSLSWQMTRKDPEERPRHVAIVVRATDRLLRDTRLLEADTSRQPGNNPVSCRDYVNKCGRCFRPGALAVPAFRGARLRPDKTGDPDVFTHILDRPASEQVPAGAHG
jgi:hypothetical protein